MRIEINLRSLLNLEHICEVLYKLHPSVLDDLVEMERSLGNVLGLIDLDNPSMEEREFLADNFVKEEDYSSEPVSQDKVNYAINIQDLQNKIDDYYSNMSDELRGHLFYDLIKYLQLDCDEYIPIKISIEVEDPVVGKKVRELVRALEKTRAPEQFYLNKREIDEYAYFAEGYGLTMNEEQKKQSDDFFDGENIKGLKELLRNEKLLP